MTGTITWEAIFSLLAIFGTISGVWLRLESKFKDVQEASAMRAAAAQARAEIVAADLAKYQTYIAENYASRDGVNRQFESVAKSITEVGERMEKRLDGMNERLDRVIEANKHVPTNSRRVS